MDEAERSRALEDWFEAYASRVLAYLVHRTDPDTAQDLLQEVFVIAHRKAEVVPEPPLAWLFGTARRVLANDRRSRSRHQQMLVRLGGQHDVDVLSPDASAPERLAVTDALSRMSSGDQEVLTLSAWYDLTPDEAAGALGCSASAYRVRLHRARRRLAASLTETEAVRGAEVRHD